MNTRFHLFERLLKFGLLTVLGLISFAARRPARIVSTFPSITETVFALGAGSRLVGVSDYCKYPEEVLALPKIGSYLRPNLEKIALLRPDLVLIREAATATADGLKSLGIPYVQVKMGSLSDVYSMIGAVGAAIGVPENARDLNGKIRSRLEQLRAENGAGPKPAILIIVGHTPGLLTNLVAAGQSTYLNELLEIAGGRNAMPVSPIAYPRISLETVVRLNPEVILDLSTMGEPSGADSRVTGVPEPWLSHRELSAVSSGRVFGLPSEPLTTPGPRVIESAEMIRQKIRQTAGVR